MDMNSITIISGLVAFVVAYAAVIDSDGGWSGDVGPIRWSFSGSWASSMAAVLALLSILTGISTAGGLLIALGVVMVLAPLIYKGMGEKGGASKPVFFIVSAIMTWATFTILYMIAVSVPALVEPLPLLPTLVINASLVLALVGAVINSARSLAEALAGDGSAAWTLP